MLIKLYYYCRKFLIILGWAILIFLAYKVSQFDYEMANFDPYEILNVPAVSIKFIYIVVCCIIKINAKVPIVGFFTK